jgi:FtsP/CotA-like multicopper oxidase with cupredoxin domain
MKIRLVNNLPIQPDGVFKNAAFLGSDLNNNPTNLHTHGLVIEPRVPTASRPTYGDNIFVLVYPQNATVQPNGTHNHGAIKSGFVDYDYDIPKDHPLGSFWFHPHAHGIALNQVSSGLSGIITIGSIGDYACADAACRNPIQESSVRHFILKDSQIAQDPNSTNTGLLMSQEDPGFCDGAVGQGPGYCEGASPDFAGGKWFFPVSGQVKPKVAITAADGEDWRLTNSSGSVSYDLHLTNDATQQDMIFQVLAVDGVSVNPGANMTPGQAIQLGGAKLRVVSCPGSTKGFARQPVCVSSLRMYPSSRIEVWVTYRDGSGVVANAPAGATATFRTVGLQTGETGDSWPAIDLVNVAFQQSGQRTFTSDFVHLRPDANVLLGPGALLESAGQPSTTTPRTANCGKLPAGFHRRIYYGVPDQTKYPDVGFGLGYEVIDARGNPVPGTLVNIQPFDPNTPVICLPLDAGNKPVKEVWELVNTATEDHNFHIHQTKFRIVDLKAQAGSPLYAASLFVQSLMASLSPSLAPVGVVLHDNVPLPAATGNCGDGTSVGDWKSGACKSNPVVVEIPFKWAGDFVYHCHILEHEDGGMMAKIRVATNP